MRLVHACMRVQAAALRLLLHPLTSCCYTPLQAAATPPYRLLLHPLTGCCYTLLQAAATPPYRLLLSPYLEPSPERADLFWVYGCPNGDTVLPMLRWIKRHLPFWNASVREGRARHIAVVGRGGMGSTALACS